MFSKVLQTLLLLFFPCFCIQAQPAVLLGPDLEPVQVELKTVSPQMIRVVDLLGETKAIKPADVLRLTMTTAQPAAPKPGQARVTLRDGQAVVGDWFGGAGNGESVTVGFGPEDQRAELPLDDLLSIAFKPDATVPAADEDDVLLLATGETLTGFVEWVGAEAVDFVIGDADDPVMIPLERVHALAIANKPKPAQPRPGALRVTTAEGSVLLVEEAELSGDALVGVTRLPIVAKDASAGGSTADASRVALPIESVLAIEPASTTTRLATLGGLPMRVADGGEVFGVAMPPRVEPGGALHLHAPVSVAFDLPEGASRLAFTAAMDLGEDIPEPQRALAGCELVVYDGGEPIARHRLTPDDPPVRLNLPLAAGGLKIALEPGVNGPVLDRVVLTDAQLLVSE